ncbi:MAG: DNA-3-methyladenine glycosylase family protein [Bacillota bacterium]
MKKTEIENGILYLASNDPKLAEIISKTGKCPLRPHNDYYNSLLQAIIGQQLSMKAADSIIKKFMSFFGGTPAPDIIIASDDQILRGLGLSNAKVKYIKDLSDKVASGKITFKNISKKTDEQIITELTQVKGIGVWTAHMFLIFTLCRPDVLPVGDLGIKKAVMTNYKLKTLPDEKTVRKVSVKNNWAPFNSIASWYLWRSLEFKN